jgi:ADP-ribosylglycohydrolase
VGFPYIERLYAGILGKIIGVYHGRPIENWTHQGILAQFGDVDRFVHEQRGVPLIAPDDDISGTFTFIRALSDNDVPAHLTPRQAGNTWLNYIVENRAILWWGGLGKSTEHTAFLRLKQGIPAPESGSAARNGLGLSEQIGGQIFIDSWGMVCPGDPERAARLAGIAASVSHDGEAIYGAQVVAAMNALAFTKTDIVDIINVARDQVPASSAIANVIEQVKQWWEDDRDWKKTVLRIQQEHGGNKWPGHVHIVPNHAVIILALLAGEGDFAKSLMISTTCGFDTDCNSGNVGAVLGVRNGLVALDNAVNYREAVNDRMLIPTANAGHCVTDALHETVHLAAIATRLSGTPAWQPKGGARFHFNLPGATQGFRHTTPDGTEQTPLNVAGHSETGNRALQIDATPGVNLLATPVFITPEETKDFGYGILASPALYPGQQVSARVSAAAENDTPVSVSLMVSSYDHHDQTFITPGPAMSLRPGRSATLDWTVPPLDDGPVAEAGIRIESGQTARVFLDFLTIAGAPRMTQPIKTTQGRMAEAAWISTMDLVRSWPGGHTSLSSNNGTGLCYLGNRTWQNYTVSATLSPLNCESFGLVMHVEGLRRYIALMLEASSGFAHIVQRHDDLDITLASFPLPWEPYSEHTLSLSARDQTFTASIDGGKPFSIAGPTYPTRGGAAGIIITNGTIHAGPLTVEPA